MTAEQACASFEAERSRLSHDLLGNEFLRDLPGGAWEGHGRMTSSDVVYMALLGDGTSRERLADALQSWRNLCSPAFEQMLNEVAQRFGFVVSKRWLDERPDLLRAVSCLDNFSVSATPLESTESAQLAASFWEALDRLRSAPQKWGSEFSDYFLRWDRSLVTKEGTHGRR